jgi:hypothetical protein
MLAPAGYRTGYADATRRRHWAPEGCAGTACKSASSPDPTCWVAYWEVLRPWKQETPHSNRQDHNHVGSFGEMTLVGEMQRTTRAMRPNDSERPSECCAAEPGYELSSPEVECHLTRPNRVSAAMKGRYHACDVRRLYKNGSCRISNSYAPGSRLRPTDRTLNFWPNDNVHADRFSEIIKLKSPTYWRTMQRVLGLQLEQDQSARKQDGRTVELGCHGSRRS